ncbi:hypothetical protein SISNIDRAFT_419022, partial [Sistotremastrum niveocremeum HHB9708]
MTTVTGTQLAASSGRRAQNPRVSPHFRYQDSNLIIRSSDEMEFHVHKSIMSSSSRVFRDMLSLDTQNLSTTSDLPLVDVSEESDVIEAALRFLYPLPRPILKSLSPMVVLFELADKYDIPLINFTLQEILSQSDLLTLETVRTFGIAKKFNL